MHSKWLAPACYGGVAALGALYLLVTPGIRMMDPVAGAAIGASLMWALNEWEAGKFSAERDRLKEAAALLLVRILDRARTTVASARNAARATAPAPAAPAVAASPVRDARAAAPLDLSDWDIDAPVSMPPLRDESEMEEAWARLHRELIEAQERARIAESRAAAAERQPEARTAAAWPADGSVPGGSRPAPMDHRQATPHAQTSGLPHGVPADAVFAELRGWDETQEAAPPAPPAAAASAYAAMQQHVRSVRGTVHGTRQDSGYGSARVESSTYERSIVESSTFATSTPEGATFESSTVETSIRRSNSWSAIPTEAMDPALPGRNSSNPRVTSLAREAGLAARGGRTAASQGSAALPPGATPWPGAPAPEAQEEAAPDRGGLSQRLAQAGPPTFLRIDGGRSR